MKRHLLYLMFGAILLAALPFSASAKMTTMNGKIMGAQCALEGGLCASSFNDPKVALERDFVFVADNGKVYFMSNVGRIPKVRLTNKRVSVTGKFGNGSIFVETIDAMMNELFPGGRDWQGATMCCWSWSERVKNLSQPR